MPLHAHKPLGSQHKKALCVLLKGEEVQRARTVSDFWQRARWVEINKAAVMGRWVPLVFLERRAAELSCTHNPPPHLLPPLSYHFNPPHTLTLSLPLHMQPYPPHHPLSPPFPHPSIPSCPTTLIQMNPNKQRMEWHCFWHRPFISPRQPCLEQREGENEGRRQRNIGVLGGGFSNQLAGWLSNVPSLVWPCCGLVTLLSVHHPGAAICQGHHQEN